MTAIEEKIIDTRGFSMRTYNVLKDNKILIIKDLLEKSAEDLLRIKNCGRRCLYEIRIFLFKHGLSLKGEIPVIDENGIRKVICLNSIQAVRKELTNVRNILNQIERNLERIDVTPE
jgi:hypothetical protein